MFCIANHGEDVVVTHAQERWIKYAQTVEAGSIKPLEAKQMWDAWRADKDHLSDEDGPKGAFQLFVKTDTIVADEDVYTKGKMSRRGDRQQKNAGRDELTKMRRRMLSNFDDPDFGEVRCFAFASGKRIALKVVVTELASLSPSPTGKPEAGL